MLINYYSSLFKSKENVVKTTEEIIELIKTNKEIKKHSEYLRDEEDKIKRDNYKKSRLSGVVWQGIFSQRANRLLIKASGLATLDIDDYNVSNITEIKKELEKEPNVYLVFLSPSGGLKVIVKIPIVKSDEEYKIVFGQLLEHFKKYSPDTDEGGKDVSRFCFLSHDSQPYVNDNAVEFKVDWNRVDVVPTRLDVRKISQGVELGERNDKMFKLACKFRRKRVSREVVEREVKEANLENRPPLPDKEIKKLIDSAMGYKDEVESVVEIPKDVLKTEILLDLVRKDYKVATEKVVQWVLGKKTIYTIRSDKGLEMWIYEKGIYVPDAQTYIEEMCRDLLDDALSTHLVNTIVLKIKTETYTDGKRFFDNNIIEEMVVENGVLNINTKEITPYTPDKIFFNKLPLIFDESKDCPYIKQHFETVLKNKEDINIMQELFGYLLLTEYKYEVAFMFNGVGRNGKGKSLELMKRFLGVDSCKSIPIQKIEEEQFAMSELHGKLANLAGDVGSSALKYTGNFKNLTGRDVVSAARKFLSRIVFTNYAKMIFACNELPRVYDDSEGFWNRWVLLDFPYMFMTQQEIDMMPEEEKKNKKLIDPEIINKMSTESELSGCLNWALEGLKRLKHNDKFSTTQTSKDVKLSWMRKSDSFFAFLTDEVEIEDCYDVHIRKTELQLRYSKYCRKHKIKPVNTISVKNTVLTFGAAEGRPYDDSGHQFYAWEGIKFKDEGKINCEEEVIRGNKDE